jgi:nicotinamidase-related amidase
MKRTLVWMDVDTQEDFMLPHGAFGKLKAIANVERIIPNLGRIRDYVAEHRVTTILATDAHVPDDPEFSTYGFPAHCVLGTSGHLRIPETDLEPTFVIENKPNSFTGSLPEVDWLKVMVHKQDFAVGTNPNFAALIEALGPCHVFATGVATQGCVARSIKSLIDLGVPVSVVVDAVGPDIEEEAGKVAIAELEALGVSPITTEAVCNGEMEKALA